MIVPSNISQKIYRKSAFDAEYDFTNKDGSTYDFTGWEITASLLSASSVNSVEFNVVVEGGTVTISLTGDQTAALKETVSTQYEIMMSKADGSAGPYFLVQGNVNILGIS